MHIGIPGVIRNDAGLYRGTLVHYFRAVFHHAQNLTRPYHNFRHMLHVTWLCYQACEFYRDRLTPQEMRELMIAALFHDFDHSGMRGSDDLNIVRAVRGLQQHLAVEDMDALPEILRLMYATEYPHKDNGAEPDIRIQILRDADLSQALSVAWIQQVVFGLATEWHKTPLEILKQQIIFTNGLRFETEWAQKMFPREEIERKLAEVREMIDLLTSEEETA